MKSNSLNPLLKMFMNGRKSVKQEAVKMLKQAAKTQKIKTTQKNTHAQRKRGMHTNDGLQVFKAKC